MSGLILKKQDVYKVVSTKAKDIPALTAFARENFIEAFAEDNDAKEMQKYIDENFRETEFLEQLNNPHSQFYQVNIEEHIAAYLKVNWGAAQTEIFDNALEIERIYVDSQYQGSGLASVLFEFAVKLAIEMKLTRIWLGVWEHNPRAIRFYEKCGFVKTGEHEFKLGTTIQTDHVMTLKLSSF